VQKVTGSVGVSNTINRSREAEVRRSLEAQRTKVLQMKAVRDEGLVLQREAENSQRIYDSLVARLSQASLESQTTQSFVNVLTVAQPPSLPATPKLLLNTLVAVFLGVLLALVVALLMELSDRRVRAPEDVVAALGLPVIGVLPKPQAKRLRSSHRALLMQRRILGLSGPAQSQRGGA